MNKDLVAFFEYYERENGVKRDVIVAALEESLRTAARKSVKGFLNVSVEINPKTGDIDVTAQKEIVEEVTHPDEEMSLKEAREIHPDIEIGEWITFDVKPDDFGRIATQAARQVITQKFRAAERVVIYDEYRHRVNELISGTVKKIVGNGKLIVDLGKVEAILPRPFYPSEEKYAVGNRVHALLYEVRDTENGGAEVVLSRSHPEFVAQLFIQEVPELSDGTVTIEAIVRDAGYRTKIAVKSSDSKVEPVGACVGLRGGRVKNILRELNDEKVDIIQYHEDPETLLQNAMSPIEIKKISTNYDDRVMTIVVQDEDISKALGKRGMNARLNGELIKFDLQIQKMSDYQNAITEQGQQLASEEHPVLDEVINMSSFPELNPLIVHSLIATDFNTPRKILNCPLNELAEIAQISLPMAQKFLVEVRMMVLKKKGSEIE